MQVARATTSGTNGDFSRDGSLCSGSEGSGFFVPDVFPLNGSMPA
jgi:hypothetical protein